VDGPVVTTIESIGRRLRDGSTTSRALVEASLAAIEDVDAELASFVLVDGDAAVAAADAADAALAAGRDAGPLHGVPVGVKDIIHMPGLPTRAGSPAYSTEPVEVEATVVGRLRAGGAVIVGKTTAHELACGVYSAPASNPWSTDRLPGGSSGGSGAAVAAGFVPMALGSDTGGSIRIPAAVCGIAGLKPTYGRVSRSGVEPLSWSLDHIGPLAATVADCALTLAAIAGPDPADPSTADAPPADFIAGLQRGVEGLRIGVLAGPPFSPMQPDVAEAFGKASETLTGLGAVLSSIDIPELSHTLAAEFGIVGPEAALYHRHLLRSRPDLIDPGIRALLVAGTLLPGLQYLKALEARRVISEAIKRTFIENSLDALITPTLPATAAGKEQEEFEYDDLVEGVTLSYVRTTAPFNLSGLPALSVPCGYDGDGMPIGLQIAGRPFDEATVLRVGAAYEGATSWHLDSPPTHASLEVA
jgi:Asp-tRNA(Asn)/Glu-tRNA(Gln) amidotransferase A subunit family amidase